MNQLIKIAFVISLVISVKAQSIAPGAPGKDAQWQSAAKQGLITSNTLESKVWATIAQGRMTEVYYPNLTVANVQSLHFLVVNDKTKIVESEMEDAETLIVPSADFLSGMRTETRTASDVTNYLKKSETQSLAFTQIVTSKKRNWTIVKSYITDPNTNSILIRIKFRAKDANCNLYLLYDPSLANSGMGDTAWNQDQTMMAQDGEIASAIVSTAKLPLISNGFYGTSDGIEDLRRNGKLTQTYEIAKNGNVVQIAKIERPTSDKSIDFVLSFDKTPEAALRTAVAVREKGFDAVQREFLKGWSTYSSKLPRVDPRLQSQFNVAAMVLRSLEDKVHRGANVASPSVPWGGGVNANENTVGGYHLIWSRDLYQVFTAFLALGDRDAASRALEFLFKVQQRPDGSFPQNSWMDGKPYWTSLQLDEIAFPLIMAYEIGRNDKTTYEKHIKPAANFIVKNGPYTPQERWEEESGYSPSTIAAEIAGLVCAADAAKKNGDEASRIIWLAAADDWARNIERWTATTTGKYGDGNYYLRITQNGKPNAGENIEINNGGTFYDEREIIDAGFLELVRLGIKSPDDPLIQKSVGVVDEVIRVNTPNGDGFYRYNHDGYGEMDDGRRWNWDGKYTGKGRLWTLLSGERGQYELALSSVLPQNKEKYLKLARLRLDNMAQFSNQGMMIPEQVWDRKETPKNPDREFVPELEFGKGTGSATPLAWSMAQFIRLAQNLKAGKNLETPAIVLERYTKMGIPGHTNGFGEMDDQKMTLPTAPGETFSFTQSAPKGTKIASVFQETTNLVVADENGKFTESVISPAQEEIVVVGVESPDGSTAFERVRVSSRLPTVAKPLDAELLTKLKASKTSPVIIGDRVYFIYRAGEESPKNILLAGDFTKWAPRDVLEEVDRGFFVKELKFSPKSRIEYKLIVDEKWGADPLNPIKIDNGVGGENSVVEMPGYQPTGWTKPLSKNPVFADDVQEIEIDSGKFGKRKVKIYLPRANLTSGIIPKFRTMYFLDGSDYLKRAKAIEVMENLVLAGKIQPFAMVFTDPVDRMNEYWAKDEFADYLAGDVVNQVETKYFQSILAGRENRAIIGASLGGITSLWTGMRHKDVFSRIGAQSASFWVDNERVVERLRRLEGSKDFRFYLDDGVYEGVDDSRRVDVMLRGKGFEVKYVEGESGHNWTSWSDRLADAFQALMK